MFAIYGFCRVVDDIADDDAAARRAQRPALDAGAARSTRSTPAARQAGRAALARGRSRASACAQADFLAVIDGMEMDVARGHPWRPPSPTLDLYCDRVAQRGRPAVGAGLRRWTTAGPIELAHHLGRALQLTNILRDLDEDAALGRLYLPRELLDAARDRAERSASGDAPIRASTRRLPRARRAGARALRRRRDAVMARMRPSGRCGRAAADGRRSIARAAARGWTRRGWRDRRRSRRRAAELAQAAGIVAAPRAARMSDAHASMSSAPGSPGSPPPSRWPRRGVAVALHEGAPQAGGRCRSYFDRDARLPHRQRQPSVLSGNTGGRWPISRAIGAARPLAGPDRAALSLRRSRDAASAGRCAPNDGRLPWWISRRSAPRAGHAGARLSRPRCACCAPAPSGRVGDVLDTAAPLWDRLLEPFAARRAQHRAARRLGARCSPARDQRDAGAGRRAPTGRVPRDGLSAQPSSIPRCAYLRGTGRASPLRRAGCARSSFEGDRVDRRSTSATARSRSARTRRSSSPCRRRSRAELLPGLDGAATSSAPSSTRISACRAARRAAIIGVIGGTAEWVFAFADRVSVTVSAADRLVDEDREELARARSGAMSHARLGLPRRAAALADRQGEARDLRRHARRRTARRPGRAHALAQPVPRRRLDRTGLPATIEGAIRSGARPRDLALAALRCV